ncbi:MAG: hypothetical protein V4591_08965, partial [Bdellovibrionota bacterium]
MVMLTRNNSLFYGIIASSILHIFLYNVFSNSYPRKKDPARLAQSTTQLSIKTIKIVQPLPAQPIIKKKEIVKSNKTEPQAQCDPEQAQVLDLNNTAQIEQNNKQVLNFISSLNLPEEVLGQNLFPRKYRAVFAVRESEKNRLLFVSLNPMQEPLEYLDKIVEQEFLQKLKSVNWEDIEN